ncbi:hypothetical protein ACWHA6_35405 [Streptomyces anthocyanicus]|uniref:hypothetical protein n=1 Tax=Streptomyces anthocyanicus TaxID=68174 RepID=UPI003663426A
MSDTTGKRGTPTEPRTPTEARPLAEPGTAAGVSAAPEPGVIPERGTSAGPGATTEARTRTPTEARTPTEPRTLTEPRATPEPGVTGETAPVAAHSLLPPGESDRLGERLHHAVAGFVDAPRASVEEADRVLEEIAARFADAVAHRRRTLRTSWQEADKDRGTPSTDTEQLRLALRDYRELADRLMRL